MGFGNAMQPEPKEIPAASTFLNSVAAMAWTLCIICLSALFFHIYTTPPKPKPSPDHWPRVVETINSANVVLIKAEGEHTRIFFDDGRGSGYLYVEPITYFEGPARIMKATRIKEGGI